MLVDPDSTSFSLVACWQQDVDADDYLDNLKTV